MNNQTPSLEFSHFPVMLNEVLKIISPLTEEKFIRTKKGEELTVSYPLSYLQERGVRYNQLAYYIVSLLYIFF